MAEEYPWNIPRFGSFWWFTIESLGLIIFNWSLSLKTFHQLILNMSKLYVIDIIMSVFSGKTILTHFEQSIIFCHIMPHPQEVLANEVIPKGFRGVDQGRCGACRWRFVGWHDHEAKPTEV